MTIPRSPTLNLIHPLIECGYNVPWLDKEPIFDQEQIEHLNRSAFRSVKRICAICHEYIPFRTNSEKAFCSVKCRQIGKK